MQRCILLYFPACRAKSCCRADDAFCYIFQPAKLKDVVELMMHFVIYSSLLNRKVAVELMMHFVIFFQPAKPKVAVELMMHFVIFFQPVKQKML